MLWHPLLPPNATVQQVGLGYDNEEGLHPLYAIKLPRVVVASVKYIVSTCLIRNLRHYLGIVDGNFGDHDRKQVLIPQVIEDVNLDVTLCTIPAFP